MLGLPLNRKPMTITGNAFNSDYVISDLAGEAIDIAVESGVSSFTNTQRTATSKWRALIQAEIGEGYSGWVSYGAVDRYRLGTWQVGNRDFVLQTGYLEYLNQMLGDYYMVLPKPLGAISNSVSKGTGIPTAAFITDNRYADVYLSSEKNADALFLTPAPGVTLNVRLTGIFEANFFSPANGSYYYLP